MKRVTSFGSYDVNGDLRDTKIGKNKKISGDSPVFGVDLGTTNSAISVIVGGRKVETITLSDGSKTMPSCVMLSGGKFITGKYAYQHRDEPSVIYSVKRHMQEAGTRVTCIDAETGEKRSFSPAEISAEILKGLVEKAGTFYGQIKDVVVTVPAYFNQIGISETKRACKLAGLNLVGIIPEPTAASLCYDPGESGASNVLIYDLGGGTFDVTYMQVEKVSQEKLNDDFNELYGGIDSTKEEGQKFSVVVKAIAGDVRLGGDDLDDELVKIFTQKLEAEGFHASKISERDRERIKLHLEHLKKDDVNSVYQIPVDCVTTDGERIVTEVIFTPSDFRVATEIIFKKTKDIIEKVLKPKMGALDKIDSVVLTGGSTKNPVLKALLSDFFTVFINDSIDADLAVSAGAAIKGKIDRFGDASVQIFDILPMSIGVKLEDGTVDTLVESGAPLPNKSPQFGFTTVIDNQQTMSVELMQGESRYCDECISLGMLKIKDIEPRPAGETELSVSITINADRLMTCYARVDGKTKQIEIDLSGEVKQAQAASVTKTEKMLKHCEKMAKNLRPEAAAQLYGIMQDVRDGSADVGELKNFIKKQAAEKLNEDR